MIDWISDSMQKLVAVEQNYLERVPREITAIFLDMLDDNSLKLAASAYWRFREVVTKYFLLKRRELVCFYSKISFKEEVLGLGVFINPNDASEFWTSMEMKWFSHSTGEIISWNTFHVHNIRKGVWGEKFNHFFPLVINPGEDLHSSEHQTMPSATMSSIY